MRCPRTRDPRRSITAREKEEAHKKEAQASGWFDQPTRRLPKAADVLRENPDSIALVLVLLAYSKGLVQTVPGGHATY